MNETLQLIITIMGTTLATSGFWAFLQARSSKKDAKTQMLLGLAHDRIVYLGMCYVDRGNWITQDEYENLYDHLWLPYKKMGGNGSAKRVMDEVNKLDIVKHKPEEEEQQ